MVIPSERCTLVMVIAEAVSEGSQTVAAMVSAALAAEVSAAEEPPEVSDRRRSK